MSLVFLGEFYYPPKLLGLVSTFGGAIPLLCLLSSDSDTKRNSIIASLILEMIGMTILCILPITSGVIIRKVFANDDLGSDDPIVVEGTVEKTPISRGDVYVYRSEWNIAKTSSAIDNRLTITTEDNGRLTLRFMKENTVVIKKKISPGDHIAAIVTRRENFSETTSSIEEEFTVYICGKSRDDLRTHVEIVSKFNIWILLFQLAVITIGLIFFLIG